MSSKMIPLMLALAAPIAANAQLVSVDGGLGVYDTTYNITWASNMNLMASQAASYAGGPAAFVSAIIADSGGVIYDTPNSYDPSGTYTLTADDFNTSSGLMDWWGAQAWVHYLDVTGYGGSSQWALPTTVDSITNAGTPNGAPGNPAITSSQMAELFYGSLGQGTVGFAGASANATQAGFTNLQGTVYRSGTEYSAAPSGAWDFYTANGVQAGAESKLNMEYALAVSPGEVNVVPLPAAAWLLLSGLGGLGVFARRRLRTNLVSR